MKVVNVGVDLDGVVSNFSRSFSLIMRKLFGDEMPIVESENVIKHWDWDKWYPATKEQIGAGWSCLKDTENFWTTLSPFSVAVDGIRKLYSAPNVVVYYITTRPQTRGLSIVEQSSVWIEHHVGSRKSPQVIVTDDKHDVINALDIEYFIDDNTFNVLNAVLYTEAKVYVVDYLHNQDVEARMKILPHLETQLHRFKRISHDNFDVFTNDILTEAGNNVE
jgi:hypothetical protein